MLKKHLLRAFSLLFAVILVLFAGACQSAANPSASENPTAASSAPSGTAATQTSAAAAQTAQNLVPLQIFSENATTSGQMQGWWTDFIQKNVGVQLELLPTGGDATQQMQAYMASGDLPDIIVSATRKEIEDAAKGNLLLCLDDYIDKLPNVVKNLPAQELQYQRDNVSNGTGKLYGIPATGNLAFGDESGYGPYLRWDLYKKMGMPAINTPSDYLPILKQMQQQMPKTEDGKTVYGFSMWKDWDSYALMLGGVWGSYYGCDSSDNLGGVEPLGQVDLNTNQVTSMLAPDSHYMQALKLYFQANQMGLVDPDSLSQNFETAEQKVKDGQVLFLYWSWQAGDYNTNDRMNSDIGYRPAYFSDGYKGLWFGPSVIGAPWVLGISANTKFKDKCLDYLNFMCSWENEITLANGPKGVSWDMDSKGVPSVLNWDYVSNSKELPGGGLVGNGTGAINWCPFCASDNDPLTNYSLGYAYWPGSIGHNTNALIQDWSGVTGYKTTTQMLQDKNLRTVTPLAYNLVPSAPDDIVSLAQSIGDIVKTASWQMIFAKNQAQFDSLYKDMVDKANGLGMQKLVDYDQQAWKTALDLQTKYSPK